MKHPHNQKLADAANVSEFARQQLMAVESVYVELGDDVSRQEMEEARRVFEDSYEHFSHCADVVKFEYSLWLNRNMPLIQTGRRDKKRSRSETP